MAAKSDAYSGRRKTDLSANAEQSRLGIRRQNLQTAMTVTAALRDTAKNSQKRNGTEKDVTREQEPQEATDAAWAEKPQLVGAVAKIGQLASSRTVVIKVHIPNCKYQDEVASFLGMKKDGSLFLAYSKSKYTDPTEPQCKSI